MMKTIVKINDKDEMKFEYIGYMQMLDKIILLMDKVSHENKMILIDKYIEILKNVKEVKND